MSRQCGKVAVLRGELAQKSYMSGRSQHPDERSQYQRYDETGGAFERACKDCVYGPSYEDAAPGFIGFLGLFRGLAFRLQCIELFLGEGRVGSCT